MSISIQGSTPAALTTLESLTAQQSIPTTAAPPLGDAAAPAAAGDVIDLSSLASAGPAAGLATSASVADAAAASASLIEGLLGQMRDAAVSATDPNLDTDARSALNAGFQSGLSQIQAAVGAAGVDGVNLIDGSANGQAGLASFDLSLGGPLIGISAGANLNDPAAAGALVGQLDGSLDNVGEAADALAAQSDALQAGGPSAVSGAAVDPSLDADAARLAALQVQQQLAAGTGPIGNQGPATILALFR